MTTCLVMGGNGFIGSHITDMLVENGYNVKVFDRKMDKNNFTNKQFEFFKGDILNEDDLKRAIVDVDYIFHYIGLTIPQNSIENPLWDNENVRASIKLFELAKDYNVKKIIFPSSGGTVYGEPETDLIAENHPKNPINPYAISKFSIEKYLYYFYSTYGLDYTVFRYSNPYGPRQNPHGKMGLIPVILQMIKSNKRPEIFGDGSAIRDYLYIEDACKVNLMTIQKTTKHKIFNVGSGTGYSVNEILKKVINITGKNISPLYTESRIGDVSRIILDISRIENEMKWKPLIDIDSGIERTWEWLNK